MKIILEPKELLVLKEKPYLSEKLFEVSELFECEVKQLELSRPDPDADIFVIKFNNPKFAGFKYLVSHSEGTVYPNVIAKPENGMKFDSLQSAELFCGTYNITRSRDMHISAVRLSDELQQLDNT